VDASAKELLMGLAAMEDAHEKTFSQLTQLHGFWGAPGGFGRAPKKYYT
jgi:rubrerythrin